LAPKNFSKKINNTLNLTAMKKLIFVLAFLMTTAICVEGHNYHSRHFTISVQTFYDELLPYGEWINTPDYGYVWRPYLDDPEDFRPYSSRGNWVNTDLGWTWVSDYRWGWATFHYGRWYFDDYLGWMWVPGNEWAPAWVTWGSYNDYWAWAPMGPNIQVNVNMNWVAPGFWWTLVPYRHFCSNNWYSYVYNQPVQITNITYITNVYNNNNNQRNNGNWFYGPRVNEVERHMGSKVRRMLVVDADRPDNLGARNNRVSVYRPEVTSRRDNDQPGKYRNVEVVRADQKNRNTTNLNTKRSLETGAETRTSNQTTKERSTSTVNTQPVKRDPVTERTVRNGDVNNSSVRRTNEPGSGTVKENRTEPARESVKQNTSRQNDATQRINTGSRQQVKSGDATKSANSQKTTGIERNNKRSNQENLSGKRNSGSNTSEKALPTRTSSSSGTKKR